MKINLKPDPPFLRILFVLEAPHPWLLGGAERHALRLAREYERQGHMAEFVTPVPRTWKDTVIKERGQCVHCLSIPLRHEHAWFKRLFYLRLCWFLFIYRHHYDLVDLHLIGTTAFILTLIKHLRKPSFLKINSIANWTFLKSKLDIRHIRLPALLGMHDVTGYLVLSRYLRRTLILDGIPGKRIHYIPDGIDTVWREPNRAKWRNECGIALDVPVILYAGRFVPPKNLGLLIQAFDRISRICPDAVLVMLGDGPLMPNIRILVNKLELSDKIYFRGIVDNVRDYMLAADIFVLPSDIEGCPNALLEAMASRLACVATRFDGADEIIDHDRNGCLVEKGDVRTLGALLNELIDDPQRRERLGNAARQTVLKNFDIKNIAAHYISTYHSLSIRHR